MSLEEGPGSTQIKKSLPSIFVKLIYCSEERLIERQELVRLAAPVLHTVIFFGRIVNLELHIWLFLTVWISHLHGKIFLVCLGFHCVDNIKDSGIGCGRRECAVRLSACLGV